ENRMSDDTRPRIEVTIAALVDVVRDALRDKDKIRHWHGWDYDGLDGEIDLIFFTETLEDASARTLRLHGGGPRPTARSSDSSAPRCALSYPRVSREELEGRFLGLMAYLDTKGEGDQSMPANQRPGPGVGDGALGDPRDRAKA